jgi:hypothetical protein
VTLIILGGAAYYLWSNGNPHVWTTATCELDARKCTHYIRCTYIGIAFKDWEPGIDRKTFFPNVAPDEDCPGIKFFPWSEPPPPAVGPTHLPLQP